jgi:NAD(P)-dependent dehydrogenase (short-subunit alcohol dehydrogenase family)
MSSHCFDLTDRVAVVIGASSGLGHEIAIGLAAYGAHVVPASRRSDLLVDICQEIQRAGRQTITAAVDVRDRASIARLRETVFSKFGRVDVLVNAAGTTFRKPTADVDDREWSSVIETNLNGVLHACQAFYDLLKTSARGRIINIASLGSFVAFHEVAAYCASKAAILSLTRSLACEWSADGICVNAIAPGVFPTELNSELLNGTDRGREILLRTPMRRFGHSNELVGPAVFLASDAASFITGQCIVVDGGYLASGVNS